jgi:hypothetical protein
MTVCYRAGKSFVYDDFWVQQKLAAKAMMPEEVKQAKAGIRFETIDPDARKKKIRWFKF